MREDHQRPVVADEKLVIASASDAVALLAWAVRVIQDEGFEILGLDPAAVRVRRAEILTERGRDGLEAHPTEEERDRRRGVPPAEEGPAYTGAVCGSCGSTRLIASGSCATCHDCGATTGCG